MVDPPGPTAAVPEPADSPARFCADFAALLDQRRVSLRAAERSSGWGKSTIATARKGPELPNVALVLDVLQGIGESEAVREHWRDRHQRLDQPPATSTPTEVDDGSPRGADVAAPPEQPAHQPTVEVPAAQVVPPGVPEGRDRDAADEGYGRVASEGEARPKRWWSRRRVIAAAVVVFAAAGGLTWWWLARPDQPAPVAGRTILVQNKVAFGPTDLEEDRSPSYLAARPIERCANVPGCKLAGTDMGSGDTVEAVCQLQGALLTNADVGSAGVKTNPNVAASSLWYGIRWPDGRRGYLSEVYVAPMYRGGLQLPPC